MRVEHFDQESGVVTVLLEDALPENNPAAMFNYWQQRVKDLEALYNSLGRTKQRQEIALQRDHARVYRNRFANLLK